MTLEGIRVLKDRVLVLVIPAETRTPAGVLTAPAMAPMPTTGAVLRVGPDVRSVEVGDVVAFPPTAGDPWSMTDTHEGLFLRESEIVTIISPHEGGV